MHLCASTCSAMSGSGEVVPRPPQVFYVGPICNRDRGGPAPSEAAEHRRGPAECPGTQPGSGPAGGSHAHTPRQGPGKNLNRICAKCTFFSEFPSQSCNTVFHTVFLVHYLCMLVCLSCNTLLFIVCFPIGPWWCKFSQWYSSTRHISLTRGNTLSPGLAQ